MGGLIESQKIIIDTRQGGSEEEMPVAKIRGLNKTVADTSSFYKTQATLSGLLVQITDALPQAIYVTSLLSSVETKHTP